MKDLRTELKDLPNTLTKDFPTKLQTSIELHTCLFNELTKESVETCL